jgi:1,4-dihydroxy-2-naphthoate octaprenyltransferase
MRPANPLPEEFSGDSPIAAAKRLFHATRPKFFPASALPVLVGTAWGIAASGDFQVGVFSRALLAPVCVPAGGCGLNVVGGDAGGSDRRSGDRICP